MQPRTLADVSDQKINLEIAAKLLTRFNKKELYYYVNETYFDYGQNWKWTTIIACDYSKPQNSAEFSYQALNPKEWGSIITAKNVDELAKAVNDYMEKNNLN